MGVFFMRFLRFAAALLLCAVLLCAFGALADMPPCESTRYDGIDVSVFQGDIDFARVRGAGIDFVYIRAGEGDDITDTRFEQNYASARAAGLQIGFYYVAAADSSAQGAYQAGRFYELIRNKEYELRPAMDFSRLQGVNAAQANAIALSFLQRLQTLSGYTPALYSDAYAAETLWTRDLSAFPLWVADYNAGGVPDSPVWNCWAGRQYSSRGRVEGITGDVDMDAFNTAILLSGTPAPSPTPGPSPTPAPCYVEYVVRRGDTLSGIAAMFNVTTQELALWNNIQNPDLIRTGQILRIYR